MNFGPDGSGGSNIPATLDVTAFIVSTTSFISIGNAAGNLTVTAPLSGAGTLNLSGANSQTVDIVSFTGLSNFTGAINLGTSGALSLSFGTSSYAFSDTFTISGTSVLRVNGGQTLTFDQGDLTDPVNGSVSPGTYSGAGLAALGANYFDGGGTIVVIPGALDPASQRPRPAGTLPPSAPLTD